MKICIIGNGLASLVLARILAKKNIKIDILYNKKNINKNSSRTIGITNENLKFLESNFKLRGLTKNPINEIKIFNEGNLNKEILNFQKKNFNQFYMLEYSKIYNYFEKSTKNLKNIKFLKNAKLNYSDFFLNKYNLIIDTSLKNQFSRKFFFNKIEKEYSSNAHVTIIKHKKIKNNIARQIFTRNGPLAFLPLSDTRTSIVFSLINKKKTFNLDEIKNLIKKYNTNYKILSFEKFENSNLKFSLLRKYFHKNVLAFGDKLHTIHPLAGQGFNMTLRDIQSFAKILEKNIKNGLILDKSILSEFEDDIKHKNIIFASGIDFIHDFFMFQNYIPNIISNKFFKLINKSKIIPNYGLIFANKGL